jgi:N-carbamoylputrescine amidase
MARMAECARAAASGGADLVLFPEAAPTGLINNDDPAHDLPLGQSVPGPLTRLLGAVAREESVLVASGLLERERDMLYDAAVLLGPEGEVLLHYRRIQPQWHGRNADPEVYGRGEELPTAGTPWGRMLVLLCGDLFDDGIVERARRAEPDYVLFPFARSFSDGTCDQGRWEREEAPAYARRAALLGCTTLMVNCLEDRVEPRYPAFGGALVVGADGRVLARWPLGQAGTLHVEV